MINFMAHLRSIHFLTMAQLVSLQETCQKLQFSFSRTFKSHATCTRFITLIGSYLVNGEYQAVAFLVARTIFIVDLKNTF